MASHRPPPSRSSVDESKGRASPTTGLAGGMDKRDLPVICDPIVGANTPISQRRKGAIEVTADEATLSPQQERFMKRKRAIDSAEAELSSPLSHHITMTSLVEPATTKIATMLNSILLPASSVANVGGEMLDKQVDSRGDVIYNCGTRMTLTSRV